MSSTPDVVKQPNIPSSYTKTDMMDLMQCMESPMYFTEKFVKIQHPKKGVVPFVLYDYQRQIIDAYHQNRFSILLCARQLGKALKIDTPILTSQGFKLLENIEIGDRIFGPDGQLTDVTFITDTMFDHNVYRVTFDNGDCLDADEEHLWTIESNSLENSETLTTKQLIDVLKNPYTSPIYIRFTEPVQFPEASLDVSPYEKGLQNDSIIPNYLISSIEQRYDLLAGFMDASGSILSNGYRCEYFHQNEQMVDQVKTLLSSLGIKGKKITNKDSLTWSVRFQPSRIVFRTEKAIKQKIREVKYTNKRLYIKTIKSIPTVPVRCLQVNNKSHLFLAGPNLIPTHNTTCAAAYLLWRAMFVPDSTILVCANKFSSAMEILGRIRFAYENLPDHIRAGVRTYNKMSIDFDNGSRIIARATTADAGRGLSISLLYIDEMAFIPDNIQQDLWTAIQPTLSTGGGCIITSTPKNDIDVFSSIWRGATDLSDEFGNPLNDRGVGSNDFFGLFLPWSVHPERDEEWANRTRKQISEEKFRQEMDCEFVSDDETLVNSLILASLKKFTKQPIFYTGAVRWYKDVEANHQYLVALDPSMGTGGDYAAIQVFELPGMTQVAEWMHNKTVGPHQVRILKDILRFIEDTLNDDPEHYGDPEIYWTVENNSLGENILQIISDTGEDTFPGAFISERKKAGQTRRFRKGLNTGTSQKRYGCGRMKNLIESRRMTIQSEELRKQLQTFVASGDSYKGKPGTNDDLVMSAMLCVRMLELVADWGVDVEDLSERIVEEDDENNPLPMIFD